MGLPTTWKRKDILRLTEEIQTVSKIYISYSTMLRVFGLDKRIHDDYNPRDATKDALCMYIGYESWNDYIDKKRKA